MTYWRHLTIGDLVLGDYPALIAALGPKRAADCERIKRGTPSFQRLTLFQIVTTNRVGGRMADRSHFLNNGFYPIQHRTR